MSAKFQLLVKHDDDDDDNVNAF